MIPADVHPPCQDEPELFFSESNPGRTIRAKALCAGCPFTAPCASYAMEHDVSGVWSGTTTVERREARRIAGIVPLPIVSNPYPLRRAS